MSIYCVCYNYILLYLLYFSPMNYAEFFKELVSIRLALGFQLIRTSSNEQNKEPADSGSSTLRLLRSNRKGAANTVSCLIQYQMVVAILIFIIIVWVGYYKSNRLYFLVHINNSLNMNIWPTCNKIFNMINLYCFHCLMRSYCTPLLTPCRGGGGGEVGLMLAPFHYQYI